MKPVLAWAMFDLANTFFAIAMLSFYFPLWVVETQGGKELHYSIALGLSSVCVTALMPFAGAISDVSGRRMQFLRWTTYVCAAVTVLTGLTDSLPVALALFGVSNVCYQLGTVFYDALMWQVAPPDTLGKTSGFGSAFGYLGSAMGLLFLWPFVRAGGYQASFIPSALFFLLFALPSFLIIRDPSPAGAVDVRGAVRSAAMRLVMTVRSARQYDGLWRFFWASFFSTNAINTVLIFMGVYSKKVLGFTEPEMIRFFVISQMFSVAGALAFSQVIPRLGAKRTLGLIWSGWIAALALIAFGAAANWLWIAGPMIGFCLGSTWATSRVLLVQLSPKDQLAEMFGLAGLFVRVSSVIGPLLWGLLVWDPARYPQAVLMLIGLLLIGLWLLRRVPEPEITR
jgi:UMF1 family MFS transporter